MGYSHRVTVRRRDDFLALTLGFTGMELRSDEIGRATPVLVRTADEALVVVEFPPQHLREEAFLPGSGGRPAAFLSGPSRLVFRVPPEITELPYDLPTLLTLAGFEPVVVPGALSAGTAPEPPGPELRAPEPLETVLEIPQRLLLSPSGEEGWAHATAPVEHHGRTELWHTRLGLRARVDDTWRVEEYGTRRPTVRAVWTRDAGLAPFLERDDGTGLEQAAEADPPRFVPNDREDAEIVWVTSNWRHADIFTPRPFQVERLMLSAPGGWLSGRAVADLSELLRHSPTPVSLAEWTHRAAMGRDSYVRVVHLGYFFPWGVPMARIDVAERIVTGPPDDRVAQLNYSRRLVIRHPLADFADWRRPLVPEFDHGMPFTRLRFTTLVTPDLDDPAAGPELPRIIRAPAVPVGPPAPDPAPATYLAVPYVLGVPFEFTAVGVDLAGQEIPLGLTGIFVDATAAGRAGATDILNNWWNAIPAPDWHGAAQPIAPSEVRRIRTFGYRIGFTPGPATANSALETHFLETGAAAAPTAPPAAEFFGADKPPYYPYVTQAVINLAAAQGLSGAPLGTPAIRYDDQYLKNGFAGDPAEVFARLANTLPLAFDAGAGGGLAVPDFDIQGLSRSLGPVGDLDRLRSGRFDPEALFGASGARLLGAVSLADVVEQATGAAQALADSVKLVREQTPDALVVRFTWSPRLQSDKTKGVLEVHEDTALDLHGELRTPLDGGPSTAQVHGRLNDFTIHFFGSGPGRCVSIRFDELRFDSSTGSTAAVRASIRKVTFEGPLVFVDAIKDYLSFGGSGPYVEVTPTRVLAGVAIALPSLQVGVFTLQNLALRTQVELSLTGGPMRLGFAICERARPFVLTVALFGGSGFFALALTTSGLELIEASLEFGACAAIDLGVASGSVSVMAGIYFKLEKKDSGTEVVLAGFLRLHGEMSVIGLISLSLDFYLGLEYRSHVDNTYKVSGRATLHVEVSVFMFSTSVEVTCERRFGGTASDPTFTDQVAPADWDEYCDAFASLNT
ncbi:hypothetical protein WN990_16115 [Kitasatospora purpeofusca]|uniref:hypothetical protein n=1 Tax=Kitasatospora purpeofusca TaxID=67352 RepID=UPI0030F32E11